MVSKIEEFLKEIKELKNFKKAVTLAIGGRAASYERLEFLGDRVLGLVIAEMLFKTFPNEKEGEWAVRFTALVKESTLSDVAKTLGLDACLITNEDYLRSNDSVLADVCEAVLGALYLEKGLDKVQDFVSVLWHPFLNEKMTSIKDAKTMLQEWAQKNKGIVPEYRVISKTGPDHEPCFEVEVAILGVGSARAKGSSKKEAMTLAAKELLQKCPVKNKKRVKKADFASLTLNLQK